jgi:tRNA dimethylallyltransferase
MVASSSVADIHKMPPLIAIVGETASGKSALALELALRFSGELICADSRTIYVGMDIGTAKPSKSDQKLIRHHLIDIRNPDQRFTAAEFKKLANEAVKDICNIGKLPILVGGTGLYIDSVIFDYKFSSKQESAKRDSVNPRHLGEGTAAANKLRNNTLLLGMATERESLRRKISERVDNMLENGLEAEAARLAKLYGWNCEALTAVGYKEFRDYFNSSESLDQVRQNIIKNTQDYAKRQRTWFKRNKSIQWVSDPSKVVEIVTTFLNK